MAKTYLKLERPIKDYPAEELRGLLGGLTQAQLLRTIILNEKQFLRVDYDRSLRGFWYATVKPTLDKLGKLEEEDTTEEGLTRWDGELSRYMAQLVRLGEVTYKGLHIVDTSRQRATPGTRYQTSDPDVFAYKITAAPYPDIILSTEKDTVYSIIADIATFFGCSCISGKGQNSLAAMEDLLRKMNAAAPESTRPIYILTMTDYDPAGYYIAETFRIQAEDLRDALGIRRPVRIQRIGITPGQLSPEEVRQNWYTPKPANLEKWMEATGGIDGRAKGLELDALEPGRIRRLFVDSLRGYVDPDAYSDFIKRAFLQKLLLDTLAPKVEEIICDMTQNALDRVELLDFDLCEMAADGNVAMPISDMCRISDMESLQRGTLAYFAK